MTAFVHPPLPLLRAFRFEVRLLPAGGANTPLAADGAFQECEGLSIEMDVKEHLEGGNNETVVRQVGRARYQPLVLKRGMCQRGEGPAVDGELWAWIQDTLDGVRPVRRYDGMIKVFSVGDTVSASWRFARGLPTKVTGPQLDAKTGGIAIEELHIAHEGLRLMF